MLIGFAILILISVVQKWVISIRLAIYRRINYTLLAVMFLAIMTNVILTGHYSRLWNLLFLLVFYLLQYLLPKFGNWYDKKIDGLSDRIADKM